MISLTFLALILMVGLLFLLTIYYLYKFKGYTFGGLVGGSKQKQRSEAYSGPAEDPVVMKSLYKPKPVGHLTGEKRVFMTNKGIRVFPVNEQGWPVTEQ